MASTPSRSRRRSSAHTTSRSTPRRVGFNRKTKVFLHLHLDDMTEEEYQATYTTEEDSHNSQHNLVQEIQTIRRQDQQSAPQNNNIDHDDEVVSIRGIEHMRSAAAMQERKAVKKAVVDAVLDEQDRQWDKDADDDEALRAASLRHSGRSHRIAAERARQDALAVRAMMMHERAALPNHHRGPHGHETASPPFAPRPQSPMDVDGTIDSSSSSTKSSISSRRQQGQSQTHVGTHATPVTPDSGRAIANPPGRI